MLSQSDISRDSDLIQSPICWRRLWNSETCWRLCWGWGLSVMNRILSWLKPSRVKSWFVAWLELMIWSLVLWSAVTRWSRWTSASTITLDTSYSFTDTWG